jgi:nitrogen fixation protein NifU and related proteins
MEDELYRQELLERYRGAGNKKRMLSPDIHSQDSNPLCGDHIEIFLRFDKKGNITDATFDGNGCVISMASASILLEQLIGKNLKEAQEITREDVLDMIGLELTPTRVKCAVLALSTMKKGIEENKNEENGIEKTSDKKEITEPKSSLNKNSKKIILAKENKIKETKPKRK